MSSPPPLPIFNTSTAAKSAAPQESIATPALCAVMTRFSDSLRRAFASRRPWPELADWTAFSRPDTLPVTVSRMRKNFSYFRVNYLTLLAAVLAVSLLSHPFSLLTLLSLLGAWIFLYLYRPSDPPVTVYGRTFSDRETLGILIVLTVVVIFLTRVGSLLMSAALIGLGMVCVHGAFRVPEDLFLDDQEPLGSGMFSFLSEAASSATVAASPSVVSRV
ncbi:PRA1 family protein B3-like [Actinidia eriantha]|uniref:PRA1 family protein B3-like n=1 Tax=Actinidia eriantha TaxID=165200 RepID=UPI002583AD8C|nr:PRA1 family protein B3-like [Actinidia eriantha]